MKTNKFITACLLFLGMIMQAQSVKTSTFMIMPSDTWMESKGYTTEEKVNGQVITVFDYDRAFLENVQLNSAIATITGAFKDRGVDNIVSYTGVNKANNFKSTYNALNTKANVKTSSLDKFLKNASPDILIEISWTILSNGPKKEVSDFILKAKDPYSGQDINAQTGYGAPSFEANESKLLYNAVIDKIEPFLNKIQNHIDDCYTNGRKVTIDVVKDASWSGELDNEYDGKELKNIIEDWLVENAVKGNAGLAINSGQDELSFNVRIPMLDEKQRGMNAESFIKPLVAKLRAAPYNIPNKAKGIKLGLAQITLGVGNK